MKYVISILMVFMIAVLGCSPAEAPQAEAAPAGNEQTPAPSFEEAMSAYQNGTWITDWDQALAFSKELGRPVLVNFTGSDWCGWCIKLKDEVFSQKAFIDYAKENLIMLTLDFPRQKKLPVEQQAANQRLAEQYGIEGFPTIVFVSETGKEINRTGYQAGGAEKYVSHIKTLLTAK